MKQSAAFITLELLQRIGKTNKIRVITLVSMMLITALLESALFMALLPVINKLTTDSQQPEYNTIEIDLFNMGPVIGILLIVIVTTLSRLWTLKRTSWTAAKIGSEISAKSFDKLISQDLEFYNSRNSSENTALILKHIDLSVAAIEQIMLIASSFLVSIAIFSTVIVIDGKSAIIAGSTLAIFYLYMSRRSGRRLVENSAFIAEAIQREAKIVNESFLGIRDIILRRYYKVTLNRFKEVDEPYRQRLAENAYIAAYPKYTLEGAGLATFLILTIFYAQLVGTCPN